MAKFDIHRRAGASGYLLDCQADLLEEMNTRLAVPLIPEASAPKAAARLNPIFDIGGERLVMVTQFAAAIPIRDMGERVGSLSSEQDAIGNALDMLISGF